MADAAALTAPRAIGEDAAVGATAVQRSEALRRFELARGIVSRIAPDAE
jgi:hypothetical protein